MAYTLGIDIGSVFSKGVICVDRKIKAYSILPSGGNFKEASQKVIEETLKKACISMGDISKTIATGYGASSITSSPTVITDISCISKGVINLFPSVRTIIDIGGQFSKVIKIDEFGRITDFILNEKCAGGSGRFLQVIAHLLRIDIEEIGPLSLKSKKPVNFNTGCAVFAESEAISRISGGASKEDILAGVHKAMASKIINLVERAGLICDCALTGGGAKDIGLVKELEEGLGISLFISEEPQIVAAYGASLIAQESSF
jgi:predicted CoA-substrate-specific enzyme activase